MIRHASPSYLRLVVGLSLAVDWARSPVSLQFTQLVPSDAYPIREEFRGLVYETLEGVPRCGS